MLNLRLKKIITVMGCVAILSGCAPIIPDNYLRSSSISSPQKINGEWIHPRLIPISADMLSSPQGKALLAPAMAPQPYRIGPFDSLNIIVWGHPEISTIATAPIATTTAPGGSNVLNLNTSNPIILVQTDGTIFFPYVGHLNVNDMTITQVQNKIASRLSKYIRNPQVTVQVAQYRNRHAYILGEVKKPGLQPLTDMPLTLLEAISSAGGINTETADPTHIYLVRGSYEKPDIFWLNASSPHALLVAAQFPLQENDIIYVSGATLNPWNRFINQVLPTFTTYFIAKDIAR